MPVVPPHTYPGVYIQELPSGVRTISGISTSVTAFIGRTARGPVNTPIVINTYADFERTFGGLWSQSTLGQVVQDFYLNGGNQAVIVRLFNAGTTPSTTPQASTAAPTSSSSSSSASPPTTPPKTNAPLLVDTLPLEARDPGSWGNYLRAHVDSVPNGIAQNYDLTDGDLFTLTLYDKKTGTTEIFRNLSVKAGSQQVDKILALQSVLARVATGATLPTAPPKAHTAPARGKSIWDDDNASTGVQSNNFVTDGGQLVVDDFIADNAQTNKSGLYALEQLPLFNLLSIPPYLASGDVDPELIAEAAAYCEKRRAMLLVDPPSSWVSKELAKSGIGSLGTNSKNALFYFPRFKRFNSLDDYVPSGAIAGIIARTDAQRGVWKSPAGIDATLVGVSQLSVSLTDDEIGELNPLGINCLRTLPAAGPIVWGARTLQGDDRLASDWKYVSVRRLTLFIEESLYEGTKWVVFEPNDEPLWAQIRLNIGSFMRDLFRQGAFQGQTPQEAYFVQCDSTTTLQNDINQGVVNIIIGFAPLKPAEFVILNIQQIAGQISV